MPDGSWLSMFFDQYNDPDYNDALGGWLTGRCVNGVITILWEDHSGGGPVTERYKVTRID